MAASGLDVSSHPNSNTHAASSLPHTPYSLNPVDHTAPRSNRIISKLSSRNRRRRHEKREKEERIPIPSFSFTPIVEKDEGYVDGAAASGDVAPASGGGRRAERHQQDVKSRAARNVDENNIASNKASGRVPIPTAGELDGKENNPKIQIHARDGNIFVNSCDERNGKSISNDGPAEHSRHTKHCLQKGREVERRMDNASRNSGSLPNRKNSSPSSDSSHVQSKSGPKRNAAEEDAVTKLCDDILNSKKRKCDDECKVDGSSDSTKLGVWSEEKKTEEASSSTNPLIWSHLSSALSRLTSLQNDDTAVVSERIIAENHIQSKVSLEGTRNFDADGFEALGKVNVAAEATIEAVASSTAPTSHDQIPSSHRIKELESHDPPTKSSYSSHTHGQEITQVGNQGSSVEVQSAPSLTVDPLKPKCTKSIESTSKAYSKNADFGALGLKRAKKEGVTRHANPKAKSTMSTKVNDVIEIDSSSTSSASSSDVSMNRAARKVHHKNGSKQPKKRSGKAETKVNPKSKYSSSSRPISKAANKETTSRDKAIMTRKQKSLRSPQSERKKLCFACSSCKCRSRDGTSTTPKKVTSVSALSGSQARQEQALISRLQRIERNVQWMESQKADVGRQLIKHRNAMTKKWEEQNPKSLTDRPKFLADVDEWDGIELNRVMESKEVGRAIALTFGKDKTKAVRKITLTQHFGATSKFESSPTKSIDSDGDEQNDTPICVEINSPLRGEPESDEEELKMRRAIAHLTSMSDFNDAIACSKQKYRVSSWESAAMAPMSSMIDNMLISPCPSDGIDELLQLFSSTEHNTDATPACIQNELDDASNNQNVSLRNPAPVLTPRGERIAEEIKISVIHEPTKLAAIERACPTWEENIEFAQLQTDPEQVRDALVAVREAKSNVDRIKDALIQVLTDRQYTLELFEKSLERSFDRLARK